VIGPVFSQESLAAADAAEAEGVPLVALSTRQDLPVERANAFRTRTTPQDEVGTLVRHAFEQLGAERFAVLYPETRYGRGMRKIYWEEVVAHGGRMVAASSYDPDAVDFSSAIRDMIGYRFLTSWERKALAERDDILRATRRLPPEQATLLREAAYSILGPEGDPLPPIVDFDVLFIPDAADKVALIAPGLAFHEISDVTLLGSSDWLDEELLRVAWRHVRGALISSPFHPSSDLPFVEDFVEGYRQTFGAEPEVYAAEAWDATNLVLVQLAAGRLDRAGVRAGLLETRAYPGATGVLTMQPDGNARRRPFLLRVSGRHFAPVD
jgi:ABC-type branched-subunit amino acid transport system substrate-binding protein